PEVIGVPEVARIQEPVLPEEGVEEQDSVARPGIRAYVARRCVEVEQAAARHPDALLRCELRQEDGHADDDAWSPDQPALSGPRTQPTPEPDDPGTGQQRGPALAEHDVTIDVQGPADKSPP